MLEPIDSVKSIKGVGDKTAAAFAKIGVNTVGELLCHYPFRYETYAYPVPISSCSDGELVSVEGTVYSTPKFTVAGRYKITEAVIMDDTGRITVKWFNAPFMRKSVKFGDRKIFRGKVKERGSAKALIQPECFTKEKYAEMLKSLKPVYPVCEGLTQNAVSSSVKKALNEAPIKDYLPQKLKKQYELQGLREALSAVHFPKDEKSLTGALSRLVFDEFFFFLLNMRRMKGVTEQKNTNVIQPSPECDRLIEELGYELTDDQKKAVEDIFKDMASDKIMQRLLQGDVGSGKTAVALIAMSAVAFAGKQACILAPTEVLAKQHYDYFNRIFSKFGVKTAFLSGSLTKKQKEAEYERIKSGEALIVVGTHAAIQEGVEFLSLALAVVDEQHRFGVKQREAITLKGENPHLLLMSATPIPRTYALMLYGDMDISAIRQLPSGRKPVKNCVADKSMRESVNRFLVKEISAGHQAYVICPLVEESDKITAAAVETYVEELRESLGGDIKIEALHGRMKPAEKQKIMDGFASGETDILVSTTVIEVGVNVPNATVMLIENAEQFGLAQLHQIRGRVGRGESQSYCIFMAGKQGGEIKKRLDIVGGSNDGFYIASQDMQLRGPGDFFGVRQSGERQFVLADPLRDGMILSYAAEAVQNLSDEEAEKLAEGRNNLVTGTEHMVY